MSFDFERVLTHFQGQEGTPRNYTSEQKNCLKMRIKRTTFPGWALREFKHCSEGQARAGTPCQFWWVSCCCSSSTLASGYARCQSHAWTLFCNLKTNSFCNWTQIHIATWDKYIYNLRQIYFRWAAAVVQPWPQVMRTVRVTPEPCLRCIRCTRKPIQLAPVSSLFGV